MKKIVYVILVVATVLASCGTKKAVTSDGKKLEKTTSDTVTAQQQQKLQFVQKVSDQALYQKNIVSKLSFNLKNGEKSISVPGSLHMRKDDVIRIQLMVPIIGTEVGRLEFTKDYVLIIDRLHKEYIKADYGKVDFLHANGINFYSLQALFWNQLFLPGKQRVGETQLEQYDVDLTAKGNFQPVILRQDKMTFTWDADKVSALIHEAAISYAAGTPKASSLHWSYADFRAFGSKQYPHQHTIHFKSNAVKQKKDITVTFSLSGVSADSKWEPRTTVSEKYKAVKAEDVLKKLMK